MGPTEEQYVRDVGGDLVSSTIVETEHMRIEVLSRKAPGGFSWHFRQPELSLFCWRGADRFKAKIDGKSVDCTFRDRPTLGIFPAAIDIQGDWSIGPKFDYTIIFLKPGFVKERLKSEITNPTVGFEHDDLAHGLAELGREAASPDNMFGLLAEGWSIQALAYMSRVSGAGAVARKKCQGGLTRRSINLVEAYVRANLTREIALQDLSDLTGLSKRHFLRAFQESFQLTPHRFILNLRVDEAKDRLLRSNDPISEVAACAGFGHVEHFSTTFKKFTGFTPSQFRRCAA